ncbi:hypothetical protein V9L05_03975 [Bernardetia sp. Wsw4-3y2]|uniref:hypothetical protein n=1 Tax=Bernardetia sp. Wsw4-3y2 TaxID=3127471 RepID=UPI0030D407C3
MKFFSIILISLFINFSSFAFMPAESKSNSLISERSNSESEAKTKETKAQTAKINSAELIEKLEANKSKMSFKERLATKLITKKLKKIEKKESKNIKSTKDTSPLGAIFRIVGVVLIILGVVGLFTVTVTAGVGAILLGLLLFILPALI